MSRAQLFSYERIFSNPEQLSQAEEVAKQLSGAVSATYFARLLSARAQLHETNLDAVCERLTLLANENVGNPLLQLMTLDTLLELQSTRAQGEQFAASDFVSIFDRLLETSRTVLASSEHVHAWSRDFLRVRTKQDAPDERMPSWRWLCASAQHDQKERLHGRRLHRLVMQGVEGAVLGWVERLEVIVQADAAQILDMSRSASLSPSWTQPWSSLELSERYLNLLLLDLRSWAQARQRMVERARPHLGSDLCHLCVVQYRCATSCRPCFCVLNESQRLSPIVKLSTVSQTSCA